MNKAIFLDRDGTINVDTAYLHHWNDFQFIDGVPEVLQKLKALNYLLIVLTNQSGIARGYFTEDAVITLHNKMNNFLLQNYHVQFDGIYYCPHYPAGTVKKYAIDCTCRKPKKGMLLQAVRDFSIDLEKSFMIGDKDSDNLYPEKLSFCKVSTDTTLNTIFNTVIVPAHKTQTT